MSELVWITLSIGGLWVVIFLSNYREFKRTPRLRPHPVKGQEHLPSVSVLVPARNEEANIRKCVRSLMDLLHPDIEIIVADDRSTDKTAEIVRRLARLDKRVRLVELSGEPPAGWMGKCHALHQAVQHGRPRGEWLLFTDADTVHHPHSLAVCLREALDHNADFFSLIPHLKAHSFWERLLQPTIAALIAMFNRPTRINNPDKPDAFANGQYILIRASAYQAIGGHEAVAGKVLEDVEMARVVKTLGYWTRLAVGMDLFQTRMYSSFGAIFQGWSKNLFLLLRSRFGRVLSATLVSLMLSVWPAVAGLTAIVGLAIGWTPVPPEALLLVAASYGLVLFFQAALRWLNRWYPAMAPLAPVGALIALLILWRSAWLHWRGGAVVWKGRRVIDDRKG